MKQVMRSMPYQVTLTRSPGPCRSEAGLEGSSDRLSGWKALGLLALGATLGLAVSVLYSQCADASPLLCAALHSAVSTLTLVGLASGGPAVPTFEELPACQARSGASPGPGKGLLRYGDRLRRIVHSMQGDRLTLCRRMEWCE
jgi:hypothetical protein